MTDSPSSALFLEKIATLSQATNLVKSYQQNINDILEKDQIDATIATLTPYIETMHSMASELDTMAPDIQKKLRQTTMDFRQSLDDLIAATIQIKEETIQQAQNIKSHNKSATAYIKANSGTGY